MSTDSIEKVKKKIEELVVQSPYPEEPFHSINTLEWLLKIEPEADIALQIAALGHDIERAIPERKISAANFETFDAYMEAHAQNSADILMEIMKECGLHQELADEIAFLVSRHETGGGERLNILVNADVLSFFQVSLPLYFDRKGPDITKRRMVWGYKKLSADSRKMIEDIEFLDDELRTLIEESIGIDI
ncbi:MAG: DUF4202 family protein [Candidatus Latescibacteria bacterium]|nr:DUF4202 family protein [Candidatus Latescibacterota bacterium]